MFPANKKAGGVANCNAPAFFISFFEDVYKYCNKPVNGLCIFKHLLLKLFGYYNKYFKFI